MDIVIYLLKVQADNQARLSDSDVKPKSNAAENAIPLSSSI